MHHSTWGSKPSTCDQKYGHRSVLAWGVHQCSGDAANQVLHLVFLHIRRKFNSTSTSLKHFWFNEFKVACMRFQRAGRKRRKMEAAEKEVLKVSLGEYGNDQDCSLIWTYTPILKLWLVDVTTRCFQCKWWWRGWGLLDIAGGVFRAWWRAQIAHSWLKCLVEQASGPWKHVTIIIIDVTCGDSELMFVGNLLAQVCGYCIRPRGSFAPYEIFITGHNKYALVGIQRKHTHGCIVARQHFVLLILKNFCSQLSFVPVPATIQGTCTSGASSRRSGAKCCGSWPRRIMQHAMNALGSKICFVKRRMLVCECDQCFLWTNQLPIVALVLSNVQRCAQTKTL